MVRIFNLDRLRFSLGRSLHHQFECTACSNESLVNSVILVFFPWLKRSCQVYHSSFVEEEGITKACGCPLLPLKSHIKGPAPVSEQGIDQKKKKRILECRKQKFIS